MRRTLILALSMGLLSACGPMGPLPPGAPYGVPRSTPHSTFDAPIPGLTFKPLSAASSRLMGGMGGVAMPASTSVGSAPNPTASAPAPSGQAPGGEPNRGNGGGAVSGNLHGVYYGYGGYFGYGGAPVTTPMALVSLTEAEAAGSARSLQEILTTIVAPVVSAWASDPALVNTQGIVGADGLTPVEAAATGPYYGGPQAGWRLMYVSPSIQEVMTFVVLPTKTTVIRMRWASLNLATVPVKIDSDVAVQNLTAAITDRMAQSAEERTGLDYFMGTSYATDTPTYGMPMPAPIGGGQDWQPRREVVYAVPRNARWNISLQQVLGKPVWDLNFYAPYEQPPMGPNGQYEDPGFNFNNSATGMVDAVTGTVIRFSRPTKDYYPRQPLEPSAYPGKIPLPEPTARPVPMASAPAP